MPGRNYTASGFGKYRFGFNGKEKDDEVVGKGNWQDYGVRMYSPRLGRFLSADPLIVKDQKYAELSPYQFASNTPIWGIDLDGLELYFTTNGELIGKYGTNTEIRIVSEEYVKLATSLVNGELVGGSDAINTQLYNKGSTPVFADCREAAMDWSLKNNGASIQMNKEKASTIYPVNIEGTAYVTHTLPTTGGKIWSHPRRAPIGVNPLGDIHSHANFSFIAFGGTISPEDQNDPNFGYTVMSEKYSGYTGYLSTPQGTLLEKSPGTPAVLLSNQLPSSPKAPALETFESRAVGVENSRQNNIPPETPVKQIPNNNN